MTESHGTWTDTPTSFSYQWEDCDSLGQACSAVAGGTSPTYVLTAADVGHSIVVQETATNSSGSSTPASSNPTASVLPEVPSNVIPPIIIGASTEGQTLTESHGTWINNPTSYTYAWYDCNSTGGGCVPVSGAGGQTYTLTAADLTHTIRVSESAGNAGGTSAVFAAATAVVQLAAPSNVSPPVIGGAAIVGHRLSTSTGVWSGSTPVSYTFQWQRCATRCADIPGATSTSYKLTNHDLGARVRTLVTATNPAGSQQAVAGPVGSVTAGLSKAQIRALLSAALRVDGHLTRIERGLEHGGYTLALRVPGAGKLTVFWYARPSHGPKVLLTRVRVRFRTKGTFRIRLILTGAGRKLLNHTKHLKLSATGNFTPVGARTTSSTKTFILGQSGVTGQVTRRVAT